MSSSLHFYRVLRLLAGRQVQHPSLRSNAEGKKAIGVSGEALEMVRYGSMPTAVYECYATSASLAYAS